MELQKMKNILAVAALSLVLGGSAWAAENTEGPSADSPSAGGTLGIDMKAAGTTEESMTAFWKGLKPEDQKMIAAKCADEPAMKGFTTEESKFCELTKKK
jgi:opacity protein-like surface antigen